MSVATVDQDFSLRDLLERAGAHIRGNRADCPECGRRCCVAFDEAKGVYYCHGAGCDFSGGVRKLAIELGVARPRSPEERRQIARQRSRSDREAWALYDRVQARRFELLEEVRAIGRLALLAHDAGPDHPATWGALELSYRVRPKLLAELAILENSRGEELIRFLASDPERRAQAVNDVLDRGGAYDSRGRFAEL